MSTVQNKTKKSKLKSIVAKGSPATAMSPLILVLFAIALVMTGIITAVFGHQFGYYRGFSASEKSIGQDSAVQLMTADDIDGLNQKVSELTSALNTARQEKDIGLANLATMRDKVEAVETTNLQLQQVNDLYAKALIGREGLPLQIIGAKIKPLPENAFEYRFDVAMLASDGRTQRLTPKLILLDETNLVKVPLVPSDYDIKGVTRIRGRFIMPDDFTPKQVKLKLFTRGEQLEQVYNWRLTKQIDDMPLSLSQVPDIDQRPIEQY